MADETIVAVYDTAEHAALAVRDLEAAGIPSSAISQHSGQSMSASSTSTMATAPKEQGFWSSLFGGEPEREHDMAVYDRRLADGSTVVTVRTPEQYLTHTMEILERHNPIDVDESAATYGSTTTTSATTGAVASGTAATAATGGEKLSLSEESLAVGKRAINRGTTRIRRYVVETPIEESVMLREETVSVERRPVTVSRSVTGTDFTDKLADLTDTSEEAVVSKTARVREEVVISVVAKTNEARVAMLKAASEIAGVELVEREPGLAVADRDEAAATDVDTAKLMFLAGDMLTSAAVAERMGQTRQNVNELLKGRRILGVRFGSRWRFPSAQFRYHELLPGLSPVLKAMSDIDPWHTLEVLLAPSAPPERRPIELLRKGDKGRALAIASRRAAEFRLESGAARPSELSPEMEADLEADLRRDRELDGIRPFSAAN